MRQRYSKNLNSVNLLKKEYPRGPFKNLVVSEEIYEDPEENSVVFNINNGEIVYDFRIIDEDKNKIVPFNKFPFLKDTNFIRKNVKVYLIGEKDNRKLYLFLLREPKALGKQQEDMMVKTRAYLELITPYTQINPYIPFLIEDISGSMLVIEERVHQILIDAEILYKKEDRLIDLLTLFEEDIRKVH